LWVQVPPLPPMENKKRVFSGSRPTGKLHLGNYLGAVKGYLELQENDQYDCIYSVVDLHGLTTPYDPKKYQEQINEVVLDYLGCGLDPKKAHLMIQSQVSQHIELAYLLSTIYPVSRLEQLPTYKEKQAENPTYVNMGLLYYPILMAADIMIYKANVVPVGKDQLPHLEVTREICRKFNSMFDTIFPETQPFITKGAYVPSLKGSGKMSKSVEGSYIGLTDSLEMIRGKLAGAPTDSGQGKELPKEGGVANLLTLVALFMGEEKKKVYEDLYLGSGLKYQELKEELAQAIYEELKPIQERRKYFEEHPQEVKEILEEGRKYCVEIAKETLLEVKKAMGLVL
jgi:tryptophanyl-tRNA synthetase